MSKALLIPLWPWPSRCSQHAVCDKTIRIAANRLSFKADIQLTSRIFVRHLSINPRSRSTGFNTTRSGCKRTPLATRMRVALTMLNGNLIATAECQFDTQNRMVSYARLLPGPPITDEDMQFLRSRGWCAGQNPDYGKLMSTGKPPFSTGAN